MNIGNWWPRWTIYVKYVDMRRKWRRMKCWTEINTFFFLITADLSILNPFKNQISELFVNFLLNFLGPILTELLSFDWNFDFIIKFSCLSFSALAEIGFNFWPSWNSVVCLPNSDWNLVQFSIPFPSELKLNFMKVYLAHSIWLSDWTTRLVFFSLPLAIQSEISNEQDAIIIETTFSTNFSCHFDPFRLSVWWSFRPFQFDCSTFGSIYLKTIVEVVRPCTQHSNVIPTETVWNECRCDWILIRLELDGEMVIDVTCIWSNRLSADQNKSRHELNESPHWILPCCCCCCY